MSDTTIETPYGMDLLWASHKDYYANLNIHLNYNARVIRRNIY